MGKLLDMLTGKSDHHVPGYDTPAHRESNRSASLGRQQRWADNQHGLFGSRAASEDDKQGPAKNEKSFLFGYEQAGDETKPEWW